MCSCCEGLAKYFLFVTNLLISILSLAVIGLGVWMLVDYPSFVEILEADGGDDGLYFTAGVVTIMVVASFTFLLACFGCCGAAKQSLWMLGSYTVLTALLLSLVITAVVLAFVGDLEGKIKSPLLDSLENYDPQSNSNSDEALVNAWDDFQREFECCGVDSWRDWQKYNDFYYDNEFEKVPESCCDPAKNQNECQRRPTTSHGLYNEGCYTKVEDWISDNSAIIGGIAIGILVVMIANFCIALYLWCGVSKDRPRRQHYSKANQRAY